MSNTVLLQKRSDYVGEYFYENDTLKFINHEEGRVVMVKEGQPIALEYQYHLKDHLGNVRTTFTTKEETEETTATLEAQYENTERSQYLKYDDTRRVLSHLFDHTNGVNPSTTPGYSIRLNGSDNERNGIARSLSVMPGDKIDMQVFGKYYDPNTPQTNQTAWDNLVGLITQVANAAQTVVVDGVGYTSGALRIPPATGVLTDPNESAAYPKAHLNWATFDRDWKFLDGGARQLQGGAEDGTDVPFAEISKSIEIKEPGYVYIWLSNTSAQQRDVFFDDFKIVHTKSPVIQQEEYYPFGLIFNGYQRENSTKNNYLYNSKELQDELNTGWLDYGARVYMPEIGRWAVIDVSSEKYFGVSPYTFVSNNPIIFIDPDGKDIKPSKAFTASNYGAVHNYLMKNNTAYSSMLSKYENNKQFNLTLGTDDSKITNRLGGNTNYTFKTNKEGDKTTSINSEENFISSRSSGKLTAWHFYIVIHEGTHSTEPYDPKVPGLEPKREDGTFTTDHEAFSAVKNNAIDAFTELSSDLKLGWTSEQVNEVAFYGTQNSEEFGNYINQQAEKNKTTYEEEKRNYNNRVIMLLSQFVTPSKD